MWRVLFLLALPLVAQEPFTGAPIERELAGGEAHRYRYPVQVGLFLYVRATQLQGDVLLTLTRPDGTAGGRSNLSAGGAMERAAWIATMTGECVITVANTGKAPARYRLEALTRTPDAADRERDAAFQASYTGGAALLKRPPDYAAAARQFAAAADRWRAAGEPGAEVLTLGYAGIGAQFSGQRALARQHMERALELQRSGQAPGGVSPGLLGNLGQLLLEMSDLAGARRVLEEGVAMTRAAGDEVAEAYTLNTLGNVYRRLGMPGEAAASLERCVAVFQRRQMAAPELTGLQNLAELRMVGRDYAEGLRIYATTLDRAKAMGHFGRQATAMRGMAAAYTSMGEFTLARQWLEKALELVKSHGGEQDLPTFLNTLAAVARRAGDGAAALGYLEQSAGMSRKSGAVTTLSVALQAMCAVLGDAREWERAGALTAEAMETNRRASPGDGLPQAMACAARVDRHLGRTAEARRLLDEALALAASPQARVVVLDELAEWERAQGNMLAALAATEEAGTLADVTMERAADAGLRTVVNAGAAGRERRRTELLMALDRAEPGAGHAERAFAFAERYRARTLAEAIADSTAGGAMPLNEAEAERARQLAAAITQAQKELFREGLAAARQRELRARLAAAELDWEIFQSRRERRAGRELAGGYGLAETRRMLDGTTALVEYALGEKESYAWVVTAEGLRSFVLPGRAAVEERVEALRALLAKPVNALTAARGAAGVEAEARRLHGLIGAPLEEALRGKARLIVVPDGRLHYLPFEVLPGWMERYRIGYAPSASALGALRKRKEGRGAAERPLLALADPALPGAPVSPERGFAFTRLPNARAEAEGLRRLFAGAEIHVGAEAREDRLKREDLSGYRYLHFATHGYLDEVQPARSGLVLARAAEGNEDGFLQPREIFGLKLRADVVTLSACQTGMGRLLAGEGVVGLSRAFFHAGAQSVVVSLWAVNDAATAALMQSFYGHLKAGVAADEALRRAKLALQRGPNRAWRHPYFWAPFVVTGDPGR